MIYEDKNGNLLACRNCKDPNHLYFYYGCLGYEAIVCSKCDTHHYDEHSKLVYAQSDVKGGEKMNVEKMPRMLKIVKYEGKLYFFDERLRQISNIKNIDDFVNLNDFEMEYFKSLKAEAVKNND